jgi:single-strand DNA-binding protein
VCWRELAENVALSLVKGMRVVVTGRLEHRTWDTEEGEHRSKVEVVADDIGPSLRFATAEVQRTERKSTDADDPPEEPAVTGPDARAGAPARRVRR